MRIGPKTVQALYERAHGRADWRPVEELYGQIIEILHDEAKNIPPDLVLGHLAERVERISASYTGSEAELVWDALGVLTHRHRTGLKPAEAFQRAYIDERFNRLDAYRMKRERRRPKPFEAIVETSRRLRDLIAIRQRTGTAGGNSAILGGSTSYGRFFNVKGNADGTKKRSASDVDLMIVVDSWDRLNPIAESLGEVQGVSSRGLAVALKRVNKFGEIRRRLSSDDRAISFSHKLAMWSETTDPLLGKFVEGGYMLSLHVVDHRTFGRIILENVPILQAPPSGYLHNKIFDYRMEAPSAIHTQRSFDGRARTPEVEVSKADGGFITAREACFIEDDRYFPGFHQNLLLPRFEIRWEDDSYPLEFRIDAFRWKLIERLRYEKARQPSRVLRLSQSHTRSFDFAPHVARKVDGG